MHWAVLFIAGLFEAAWAVGLKYTEGWTKLWPSMLTLMAMGISFWLLAYALREIPIGTGYAVWTGIGTVTVAILGMVLFGESTHVGRLFFIGLILLGIMGLKWISAE